MAEHFLSSLAADLTGFDCWFLWILLWNTIAYTLSLQFSLLASSLKSKTAEAAAVYYDSSHVYEYTAVTVSDDGVFEEVLLFILSNAVGTLIWLGRGRNRTRVEDFAQGVGARIFGDRLTPTPSDASQGYQTLAEDTRKLIEYMPGDISVADEIPADEDGVQDDVTDSILEHALTVAASESEIEVEG